MLELTGSELAILLPPEWLGLQACATRSWSLFSGYYRASVPGKACGKQFFSIWWKPFSLSLSDCPSKDARDRYLTPGSPQLGQQRAQDRLFPNACSRVSEVLHSEIYLLQKPQLSLQGLFTKSFLFFGGVIDEISALWL